MGWLLLDGWGMGDRPQLLPERPEFSYELLIAPGASAVCSQRQG
jgi:hypothetical protein